MKKKNIDLGVRINVQVKCGPKYISSQTKDEIRVSIDDEEGLLEHIEYWRKQNEPTILVYVNPSKPSIDKKGNVLKDNNGKIIWIESRLNSKAWWLDLKSDNLRVEGTKTIISIPKKNVFGEHSKGDFMNLIKPLLSINNLPLIELNSESKNLLSSVRLKDDARKFYRIWKNGRTIKCTALNKNIRVSRTGWNHILSSKRGKERRVNSLNLLGVAKQIICEVEEGNYYLLNQKENSIELEQKYGIRARFNDKSSNVHVVQVIVLRKLNKLNKKEKLWFYSVHYRR